MERGTIDLERFNIRELKEIVKDLDESKVEADVRLARLQYEIKERELATNVSVEFKYNKCKRVWHWDWRFPFIHSYWMFEGVESNSMSFNLK